MATGEVRKRGKVEIPTFQYWLNLGGICGSSHTLGFRGGVWA